MEKYTLMQWLFFFFFYCFGGWVVESCYVSIKSKKWVNRGFLRGPFLPIYGCGATTMYIVSLPFQDNIALTYFSGAIGATILEFVTGVLMEAIFEIRYWDYSYKKYNIKGHICLSSTIAWGFYTIAMTEFIHKPVEKFMYMIPPHTLTIITWVVSVVFFMDFALSFKAALDIRDILVKMENAKLDMDRVQKRLDVIIAVVADELSSRKDDLAESFSAKRAQWAGSISGRFSDMKSNVGDKFDSIRSIASSKPSAYLDSIKEELIDLKAVYLKVADTSSDLLSSFKEFFKRDIIKSNPDMVSERHKESLEELKESVK